MGFCLTDMTEPDTGMTLLIPRSNTWHEPLMIPSRPTAAGAAARPVEGLGAAASGFAPQGPVYGPGKEHVGYHPPGAVQLRMRAGDAFLFESRTYHSAGHNVNLAGPAKLAIFAYSYCWVAPDAYLRLYQGREQPESALLEGFGDAARQLLGAKPTTALVAWGERHGLGERLRALQSPQWVREGEAVAGGDHARGHARL